MVSIRYCAGTRSVEDEGVRFVGLRRLIFLSSVPSLFLFFFFSFFLFFFFLFSLTSSLLLFPSSLFFLFTFPPRLGGYGTLNDERTPGE